jgi:hypothetical protein
MTRLENDGKRSGGHPVLIEAWPSALRAIQNFTLKI